MRFAEHPPQDPRRGAAAVELAVSLPLLLLLLLGCIDVGRFALKYICLTSATSEAATFASLNAPGQFGGFSGWVAAVQQRAISESTAIDPPLTTTEIVVDTTVIESGLVSVEVSSTFETLITWPGLPHRWTLTRKVVLSQTP